MPPKKGKDKAGKPPGVDLLAGARKMAAQKPKKIPPPPACFKSEEIAKFKEVFREFDEDNMERLPLKVIPTLLRKLGFNPKTAEIKELFARFLEDDMVDTVEFHELLFMIEAKMIMGDDVESTVMKAFAALGHDDEENTKMCQLELLKQELETWGEPIQEIEFVDLFKMAVREKCYDVKVETGLFAYEKFVDVMNSKDNRFLQEPVNFFKLDQKTLAAMAIAKAEEEKAEQAKKEAEKAEREEARRQKMIRDGLLPPDP